MSNEALSPECRENAVKAFHQAIEIAGGQVATANICRCTQGNISQLFRNGSLLPSRYVLSMEAATGVSRHDLRPDIYPRDALALPASVMCEETPLCGPILSARAMRGQGKAQAGLDREQAA